MKKPTKSIITSSLLAIAFGALSVGTTFALFTSEASTTINVGAAEVRVGQTLAIESVSELGNVAVLPNASGVYTNSIGGKTYIDEDNASLIHLENWAPGDKAVIKVTNTNYSNVTIKTRFNVKHTSTSDPDLWDALTKSYVAKDAEDNDIGYKYLDWSPVEPSVSKISDVFVTIEFPDGDSGQILFGDANHDNEYQNCNCSIIFTQEAVQANVHTDSLLDQLNALLDNAAATDGRNETMFDALKDVESLKDETQIKSAGFVWCMNDDHFYYGQENTTHEYFRIYDSMPSTQTNSIYASGSGWTSAIENLTVGFDAGKTSVPSISYDRSTADTAQTVVIRTNGGTLSINAPLDTVKHFGDVVTLNIIAVAGSSYHENGTVSFAEIKTGRIVLEENSQVVQIHLAATDGAFNDITVAKDSTVDMPQFSRDPVTIPEEGRLVVALQDSTESTADKDYVWLTAVGVYEQVTVSDSKTEAGNSYAANSEDTVKQETAQQIANNISATVGGNDYTLTASTNDGGQTWTYALESEAVDDITENVAVAVEANETTVIVAGEEQTTKTENGITEEQKDKIIDDNNNGVAKIGPVRFTTLQGAVDAAKEGDTIVVLKDIDYGTPTFTPVITKEDVTFTLDLNGYIVSASINNSPRVLINYGDMTLIDSSTNKTGAIINTLTTGNDCSRTIQNVDGASLTIAGAKVISNNGQAIFNQGNLVLNSGAVVGSTGYHSGNYSNGAVAIDSRSGTITINTGASVYSEDSMALFVYGEQQVTINGGDIRCYETRGLFSITNGDLVIKGGTYNLDPSMYVPFGYDVLVNDGIYSVVQRDISFVNATNLEELKAAAAAATDINPAIITLKNSINIAETVTLSKNVLLIIDNGVSVTISNNGVLINDNYIENNGSISVTGTGFLSNPLNITGNGALSGYTEPEYDSENEIYNYTIYTPMDLQWLAVINGGETYDDINVTLNNDIVIPEGVTFQQIPAFAGIFNGNNKSISGLVMNSGTATTGMFGYLSYTTIKDLTINLSVTALTGYASGVAYYIGGSTFFENVTLNGSITVGGSGYGAGAFAGIISGSNASENIHFVDCVNNVNISAPNASIVGGFYGTATSNNSPIYVINCQNNGNIVSGGYGAAVGGFMSYNLTGKTYVYGFTNTGSLTGSYSTGKFDGSIMILGADGYGEIVNSAQYDCAPGENGAFVFTPKN